MLRSCLLVKLSTSDIHLLGGKQGIKLPSHMYAVTRDLRFGSSRIQMKIQCCFTMVMPSSRKKIRLWPMMAEGPDLWTSLFPTLAGAEPYMGDVGEESEDRPAKYMVSPPISQEDMDRTSKIGNILYTLKECFGGLFLLDQGRHDALLKLFSDSVEVQDPLICLRGVDNLRKVLQVWIQESGVTLELQDIYFEDLSSCPFKCKVYAAWTATLVDDWEGCLRDKLSSGQAEEEEYDTGRLSGKPLNGRKLNLSGDSQFHMDESGQIRFVTSRWFEMSPQAYAAVKLRIAKLLLKVDFD